MQLFITQFYKIFFILIQTHLFLFAIIKYLAYFCKIAINPTIIDDTASFV